MRTGSARHYHRRLLGVRLRSASAPTADIIRHEGRRQQIAIGFAAEPVPAVRDTCDLESVAPRSLKSDANLDTRARW